MDKLLVDMPRDTTGTKLFGQKLGDEWTEVRKAVAFEATAFNLVSLRLGYFEDLANQRGGIVLEKDGSTYHYGLGDVLTKKNLGTFERIGLCWGFGLGTDRRHTLAEIGRTMGISRERVRQLKNRAISKLYECADGNSLLLFLG